MSVELIGGPWDGAEIRRAFVPPLAWVDGRLRLWRRPGPGRVLYRLAGHGHYEYDGAAVQCAGCGWIVPRTGCPLCAPSDARR